MESTNGDRFSLYPIIPRCAEQTEAGQINMAFLGRSAIANLASGIAPPTLHATRCSDRSTVLFAKSQTTERESCRWHGTVLRIEGAIVDLIILIEEFAI